MPFTQWIYPAQSEERLRQSRLLQREQGIPALLADILAARGFGADYVAALLTDDGSLEDPFLLPDMQIAVDRIEKAIESGEKIAVYGDYDCDGVTSTVILYSYLQSMGADVCYYIPDRLDEGFGMNRGAVDHLHEQGVTLIITVDNGTSALDEVAYDNENLPDIGAQSGTLTISGSQNGYSIRFSGTDDTDGKPMEINYTGKVNFWPM